MADEQAAHIDELVRVAVGERTARDAIIHEPWRRCAVEHKLDPTVLRHAHIVPQGRLREHRDAMDAFIHTARFNRWNVSRLARQMSVDHTAVHRSMRRFGIVPPQKRD